MSCYGQHFVARRVPVPETTGAMSELAADIRRLYEDEQAGGRLHIVLDDWNLQDGHIRWCQDENQLTAAEASIAERLLALTLDERHVVLGHANYS